MRLSFTMLKNLTSWAPRPKPSHLVLEEKYVRLEPLNAQKHEQGLFEACTPPDAEKMFFYMLTAPPQDRQEFNKWMVNAEKSENPLFFVIIDKASGKIGGRQMFKNIDEKHGYIEIGGVLWNDPIRKRPAATEAVYLFAKHIFEDLGYRRFEWRCNSRNAASRQAALRFGFQYEATFLYHMGTKGQNRDTTIFAMLDCQWPAIKQAFEEWLSPENFDENGVQKLKLNEIRSKYEDKVSLPSIDPPPPEISVEESEHNALSIDMRNWTPRQPPSKVLLKGQYVYLEPLDIRKHGDGLYEVCTMPDGDKRFDWLPEHPAKSREEFQAWLEKAQASTDPLYFVVIDKASGKVAGRQTFLRIVLDHGVIEVGHILWSSIIARKPAATEALYLFAKYMFDDLGYRRFEWKCNNLNEASKKAAIRFGFRYEGIFRQHMVVKGQNRDTAWFAMLNSDWPLCKQAFEKWLDPENFDENGQQKRKLNDIRDEIKVNLFKN